MYINIQALQYMRTNTFVDGEEVVAIVLREIADKLMIHMPSICKTILEFGGGSETRTFCHYTQLLLSSGVDIQRRKCMVLPLLKFPKLRADLKDGNTDITKHALFSLTTKFTYIQLLDKMLTVLFQVQ